MKKIRKVGRTQPRDSVDFYKENPDLYANLQNGETIEVPDDLLPRLKGVVETDEDIISNTTSYTQPKEKKTLKNKTNSLAYLEANLSKDKREAKDGADMELNESSKLNSSFLKPEDIVIEHEDIIETEDKVED